MSSAGKIHLGRATLAADGACPYLAFPRPHANPVPTIIAALPLNVVDG